MRGWKHLRCNLSKQGRKSGARTLISHSLHIHYVDNRNPLNFRLNWAYQISLYVMFIWLHWWCFWLSVFPFLSCEFNYPLWWWRTKDSVRCQSQLSEEAIVKKQTIEKGERKPWKLNLIIPATNPLVELFPATASGKPHCYFNSSKIFFFP